MIAVTSSAVLVFGGECSARAAGSLIDHAPIHVGSASTTADELRHLEQRDGRWVFTHRKVTLDGYVPGGMGEAGAVAADG